MRPVLKRLRMDFKVIDVWIDTGISNRLNEVINENIEEKKRDLFFNIKEDFIQTERGKKLDIPIEKYESLIESLFKELMQDKKHGMLMEKIFDADDYLPQHASRTCYLSLVLGIHMQEFLMRVARQELSKRTYKEEVHRLFNFEDYMRSLALGMLLHDIGKLCPDIFPLVNKKGRLTEDEFELMKQHTVYGYIFLGECRRATSKTVALDHHQNHDGSGYPVIKNDKTGNVRVMNGQNLHPFAKIARLVDSYDAATSNRHYQTSKLPIQVMHEIYTDEGVIYDPEYKKYFFQAIPAFPIGEHVKLSNGLICLVVDINKDYPCRPWVQVVRDPNGKELPHKLKTEINLAEDTSVSIIEQEVKNYDDPVDPTSFVDVTPFLF